MREQGLREERSFFMLKKYRNGLMKTYATGRFRIRHLQALGGVGLLDPKWLDISESTSK